MCTVSPSLSQRPWAIGLARLIRSRCSRPRLPTLNIFSVRLYWSLGSRWTYPRLTRVERKRNSVALGNAVVFARFSRLIERCRLSASRIAMVLMTPLVSAGAPPCRLSPSSLSYPSKYALAFLKLMSRTKLPIRSRSYGISLLGPGAPDVAEDAPEVLVSGVGEEGAAIGEHAHEA